jgi:hypothetical protein
MAYETMTPEFAVEAVDHHLLTINKYLGSGNKIYIDAAKKLAGDVKKHLERCTDETVKREQIARIDAAFAVKA